MNVGQLEDEVLYALAKRVVPEGGSDVDNSQITGLLSTVRASKSWILLRKMSQHQYEKARKDGPWGEERAAFFERLFKALGEVEKYAEDQVRGLSFVAGAKLDAKQKHEKEQWAGRFALTLMTHIAAEHRWQRSLQ
jgi:hypothetical protein